MIVSIQKLAIRAEDIVSVGIDEKQVQIDLRHGGSDRSYYIDFKSRELAEAAASRLIGDWKESLRK